jgi:hypothetical protein
MPKTYHTIPETGFRPVCKRAEAPRALLVSGSAFCYHSMTTTYGLGETSPGDVQEVIIEDVYDQPTPHPLDPEYDGMDGSLAMLKAAHTGGKAGTREYMQARAESVRGVDPAIRQRQYEALQRFREAAGLPVKRHAT